VIFNLDPDLDPNRGNPDAHWRLYLHPVLGLKTICVQDFDYSDYDASRLVTYQAWDSEQAASDAIVELWDEMTLVKDGMESWVFGF